MALTLNGTANTISGLAVGGLPDGIVDTDMLAASAVTSAKTSGRGLQAADSWCVTSDWTDTADVTSNWARSNDAGQANLPLTSGMSESSGIFTFPSTGYWFVRWDVNCTATSSVSYVEILIKTTTNNSSYSDTCRGHTNFTNGSGTYYNHAHTSCILDVTDVSQVKVKFRVTNSDTVEYRGNGSYNFTYATFLRLGDT